MSEAKGLAVAVLDAEGKEAGQAVLSPDHFGAPVRPDVLHEVVVAYLANRRRGTHSAKTRAEVRGGGRKPWRQKHLGRARAGSIRSPIWVGGGVAHGPKPRDYSVNIPRKKRRLALAMALSARAREGRIRVAEPFIPDPPKTKEMAAWMRRLHLLRPALLVVDRLSEPLQRASRNLPDLTVREARNLNALEVLRHEALVFTRPALEKLGGRHGS